MGVLYRKGGPPKRLVLWVCPIGVVMNDGYLLFTNVVALLISIVNILDGRRAFAELTELLAELTEFATEHLLRQNFPFKGKLGEFPLRAKSFTLRDNFPLRIAFPFPQSGQFSHEMKGLRKRSFYIKALREIYDFPREGKFTSSHFLPQKMLWEVCHRTQFGISQEGSPERCRFRFLPFSSVFLRFHFFLFGCFFGFRFFLSFSSIFVRFLPFHFQKKKRGDTVRETPFAKPRSVSSLFLNSTLETVYSARFLSNLVKR